MYLRLATTFIIFSITWIPAFCQTTKPLPYEVDHLEKNYRFYPFDGLKNHGFKVDRLEAGIGNGELVDMWSRLMLAKLFRVDELIHLKTAYALANRLSVDDRIISYICYEIAHYYSNRYHNSFARVYAGKGLSLVDEGSYEWLLNWYEYSDGLSEDALLEPYKTRFNSPLSIRNIEQNIVLIETLKERADAVWIMEELNKISGEVSNVSPYLQMIYYQTRLFIDGAIEGVGRVSSNTKIKLLSLTQNLAGSLSERDIISNEFVLSERAIVDGDYMLALEHIELAIRHCEELISHKETPSLNNLVMSYKFKLARANCLLLLTRLGKGIPPVKEAFGIYEEFQSKLLYLIASNTSSYDFLESYDRILANANILIIGGYLYQKTGDVSYLSKGLSVIDLMRSTIVYAQAKKPKDSGWSIFGEGVESRWIQEMRSLSLEKSDFDELIELADEYEEYLDGYSSDSSFDFEDMAVDQPILEIQEQLDDSRALIYLVEQKNLIISILISKDSLHHRYYNSSIPNITGEIDELVLLSARPDLSNDETEELTAKSRRIYAELIKEFEAHLPKNVEIITNGSLDGIPFGLLRMDSTGSQPVYFGDEYTLSYSYSLRTRNTLQSRTHEAPRQQIFAMAPMFEGPVMMSSRSRDSTRQVGALANNRDEVEFIQSTIPGRYVYDESATRSSFASQASDYSVIHLATHAEANAANGNMSRIYFADVDEANLLYAFELSDMELKADLVVLSACETGTGGRKGFEGRVGLSQAFLAAGANSVLSTRWSVDDRATAEIMADFYTHIKSGAAKDRALHLAQQAYRERHRGTAKADPFYWAAFDLIGDPSPIAFKGNFHYNWWKWAAGGLAFLILIGSAKRKR